MTLYVVMNTGIEEAVPVVAETAELARLAASKKHDWDEDGLTVLNAETNEVVMNAIVTVINEAAWMNWPEDRS